jgi:hypothetical protein
VKPKILVVDIETLAGKSYFWKLYDETMGVNQVIEWPRILCWGAQWLGSGTVMQGDERNGRKAMLNELAQFIDAADAVISYNGDKFDLPKINGELLLNGLDPLPPVTSIDLLKTVRKLGLASNRLEAFAIMAKIGRKIANAGFPLWRACDEGDASAWTKMLRYNAGDVRLTGRAYKLLRPFIRNHPYLGGTVSRDGCPRCSGTRSQARGTRRTRSYIIQRLQCLGCGGWFDGSREKVKT